jgi:MFS transporter, DHA1 family, inner membrane transport protein
MNIGIHVQKMSNYNLHITDVSPFLLAIGLGPALGNWISGIIIDRVGSTRPIFLSLVGLLIIEPVVAVTTHSVPGALLSLFLWGLCVPLLFTPQQHRLLRLAPEHANVILALNNSTFYLGIAGGAALGGLALRTVAVTQLGWIGAGCVLLALVLFGFSVRRSERKTEARKGMEREEAMGVPE